MALPAPKTAAGISYREAGRSDAPALVLLHGIGSTSAAWSEQYGPFGERCRVIAWTAPGYDGTPPLPAAAPAAADYAAALARLLDALQVERADVVTSSWGTLVGLAFASAHPARVRSLVLGGPSAGAHGRTAEERARLAEERIERMRRLGPQAQRLEDIPRLLSESARPEARAALAGAREHPTVEGYVQALRMLFATDGVELIKGLSQPVLVVSGTEDRTTPPEMNARKLQAAARNARFEAIEGCGHLPHLEKPERFNALVLGFLAG